MNVRRGDVVLIDFPYPSGIGSKVRPALVVQNDRDNQRLVNTILVQITSVTHRALEPTQLLIELNSDAGIVSGLRQDSVINCANFLTVARFKILRHLGSLPEALMLQVNRGLNAALEIPSQTHSP
jgi:mRNA interferase MazF